jgi:hypothetical protein
MFIVRGVIDVGGGGHGYTSPPPFMHTLYDMSLKGERKRDEKKPKDMSEIYDVLQQNVL